MKSPSYKFLEQLPESWGNQLIPCFSRKWEALSRWILFLVLLLLCLSISSNWIFSVFCFIVLFSCLLECWDFYRTPSILIPPVTNSREESVLKQKAILPHQLEYLVEWITEQRYTSLFISEMQQIRTTDFKSHNGIVLIHASSAGSLWTSVFPVFQKYNQKLNPFLEYSQSSTTRKKREFWPKLSFDCIMDGGNVRRAELKQMSESPFIEFQHHCNEQNLNDDNMQLTDLLKTEKCSGQKVHASYSKTGNYNDSYLEYLESNGIITYSPYAYPNNKDFPELFSVISPTVCGIYLIDILNLRLQVMLYKGHVSIAPIALGVEMMSKYLIPYLWKWNIDRKIKSLSLWQILQSWTMRLKKRPERSSNQY